MALFYIVVRYNRYTGQLRNNVTINHISFLKPKILVDLAIDTAGNIHTV